MLLLAFLLSCNDHIINEVKQPEIIVAPTTLEFGHLLSGHESRVRTVTIANGGSADLVVDRISISGDNYTADESGFVVESGGYYQIEITYDPKTFEHNEGYLDIYLEGDEAPSEGVWLNGNGDAPVINVSPLELDFGEPLLGCEPRQEITIDNDGNVDLIVSEIDFMSTIPQEIALSFGTLPEFPWVIAPLTRLSFYVDYVPTDEADDVLDYEISSNDPLQPLISTSATGAAVLSNETIQRWIQQHQVVVDIVWVVDNSGSMASFQSILGTNMNLFMSSFLQYYPDFQMAFITTDSPFFVGPNITNSTTDPTLAAHDIIDSIGTRGQGHEKGLQMLQDCINIGDCQSWMRPNAVLVAIFVADELDGSPGSWTDYVAAYDSAKPNMFSPYGIIGDVPGGCIAPNGRRVHAGMGYHEIIDHYLGQWWSICNEDWGDQMEEVAESISVQTSFLLDEEDPVVDSIVVWVNGQQIDRGWIYDANSNSVVFDGVDVAPEPGDTLEVSYSTWGCSGE
jgi:hypothetical protein